MITAVYVYGLLQDHLPAWVRHLKCKKEVKVILMPRDIDNPYDEKIKVRYGERSILLSIDEQAFNLNPDRALQGLLTIVEDFVTPRKPCIASAAMSKNQVPIERRGRRSNWRNITSRAEQLFYSKELEKLWRETFIRPAV